MSSESNGTRKIGEYFNFQCLGIVHIDGKSAERVTYGYDGKYLKEQPIDREHYISNDLFEIILKPLKERGYEIKRQRGVPENKFKIEKDGSVFTFGHTTEVDDRLIAKSTNVTEGEKFRLFLHDLESSMESYRE